MATLHPDFLPCICEGHNVKTEKVLFYGNAWVGQLLITPLTSSLHPNLSIVQIKYSVATPAADIAHDLGFKFLVCAVSLHLSTIPCVQLCLDCKLLADPVGKRLFLGTAQATQAKRLDLLVSQPMLEAVIVAIWLTGRHR